MTTELEQEFFKVFNIKPTFRYIVQSELPIIGTDHCRPVYDLTKKQFKNFALSRAKGYKLVEVVKIYPKITDRKLLEMICILNDYEGINVKGTTIEELKEELLNQCIEYFKYPIAFEENADLCNLHNKIQQLFKEGE